MGVESRLISRTISHGLEFSRGSGTFAIENWPERWGAASQAVIRIRRPAVYDRSESSLLVSTSSCARLRNGSSAADGGASLAGDRLRGLVFGRAKRGAPDHPADPIVASHVSPACRRWPLAGRAGARIAPGSSAG